MQSVSANNGSQYLFLGIGFLGACAINILCLMLLSSSTQAKEVPALAKRVYTVQQKKIQTPAQEQQQLEQQQLQDALPPLPQLLRQHASSPFAFPGQALAQMHETNWRGLVSLNHQIAYDQELVLDKRAQRKFVPDLSRFYPKRAKRRGMKGHSVVDLFIDVDGSVERFEIIESIPAGIFDAAVEKVVQQIRYQPAQAQGQAQKDKQRIKLVWSLQ